MSHTLIASISGIRGIFGHGLDASTLVKYAAAFGTWCRRRAPEGVRPAIVVGRDGRVTGVLCSQLVSATLQSVGCDVVDAGLSTTPTVQIAIQEVGAAGGVILSASHNPAEWNALKLQNEKGEYLTSGEGAEVLALAASGDVDTTAYDGLGTYRTADFLDVHIERILALPYLDPDRIAARALRVVVDGINSVGALALPRLLHRLGVAMDHIHVLNAEPNGRFAHPAEPLPEHLVETRAAVSASGADLGLVTDPDADRLALIAHDGTYVSEELTQVAAADYLWRHAPGPFVTNLSSSRAIDDLARRYVGASVSRSAVGEINVVLKMKEVGAVLGGEGNGGVILPDVHYGRDALVGAALILQHLADRELTLAELRDELPSYALSKNKLPIGTRDPDRLLSQMAERYADADISTLDGLKINLEEGWVHLRKSNTEPILRIYSEARTEAEAHALARRFLEEMKSL